MRPIALINPPRLRRVTRRPGYTAEPHLGLAYVAASLQAAGFPVRVVDGDAMGLDATGTAKEALRDAPAFVGLTAPTVLVKSAAAVAAEVKRLAPGVPVVLGGYHATVLPEESLREFPAFDVAAVGDGERTAVALARSYADGADLRSVPGICYRDASGIARTGPDPAPLDLDSLPRPAWDLFPLAAYRAHYRTDRKVIELPVNAGRGCVGRCTFCARVSGDFVRRRSAAGIVGEVRQDVERHGAGAIVFMDESFAHDRRLVAEVCRGLIADGLHRRIYWLCQTRVDSVDGDTLRLMAEAGCRHVSFGVESGDPEILARADKRINPRSIRQAVREAHDAGLLVDNFFIFGLPGETRDSIRRTVDFAVELDSDFANFFLLVPYPGTEIHDMARRGEGGLRLLTTDWDFYGFQMGRALELEGLPRARLERAQFLAYLRFYLRPRKIRKMLRVVNLRVLPIYLWHLLSGWLGRRGGEAGPS